MKRSPFGKRVGEKPLDTSMFFKPAPERRTEPFISWRAWKLSDDGKLRSLTSQHVWDGPVCTTQVLKNGQPVKPMWDNKPGSRIEGANDAGVYSYKDPTCLPRWLPGYPVYGRIENYGHVVEHELGYRSQKVIIQELWISPKLIRQESVGDSVMDVLIGNVTKKMFDNIHKNLESLYGCEVKTGNFADWINQQEKEWVR